MDNYRFKEVPALNTQDLPFVATEKNLSEWLNSLSVFPNEVAAEKILHASFVIAQLDVAADMQLRVSQKILQMFHIIAEALQKNYLDATQPLDEHAARQVEWVVWNYIQLARIMLKILRRFDQKLVKEQQVLALYLGLEALNYAQLHIAISYRLPMHGFWALAYEFYHYAEQAGLLALEVNRRDYNAVYSVQDESVSIEKAFKQLMIFYLSDSQQFRPRDMLVVFRYLMGFAMKAKILSSYQQEWQQGVCVFNLNVDKPPQRIFDDMVRNEPLERFIAPVMVAKNMYEATQQKSANTLHMINYEVILRAINSLGLGRRRKFKRMLYQSSYTGLFGLNDLIDYLQSKVAIPLTASVTKKNITQPDTLGIWQKHQFDLVPAGDEVLHQMRHTYQNDISHNTQLGKLLKAGSEKKEAAHSLLALETFSQSGKVEQHLDTFEVQDSSAKGYGLLTKVPNIKVKIGDVLAIIKDDGLNVELGLVRRINQMPEQLLHLGVEVIGFRAELASVFNRLRPDENMWAIFLPGAAAIKQPDSLIYSSSLLKVGEIVSIVKRGQEQQFRLQKVIQATSAVVHMELQMLD